MNRDPMEGSPTIYLFRYRLKLVASISYDRRGEYEMSEPTDVTVKRWRNWTGRRIPSYSDRVSNREWSGNLVLTHADESLLLKQLVSLSVSSSRSRVYTFVMAALSPYLFAENSSFRGFLSLRNRHSFQF